MMTMRRSKTNRRATAQWSRLVGVLVLAALLGPSRSAATEPETSPKPKRPNVLLVVMDTNRFDDWSWLDPSSNVTPVLDGLAERGHRFTDAHSLYTVTLPSHITMFTGREVAKGKAGAKQQHQSSLFTILGQNSYRTYGFSGNELVSPKMVPAMRGVDATSPKIERLMTPERLDSIYQANDFTMKELAEKPGWKRTYSRHRRIVARDAPGVNQDSLEAMRAHHRDHADKPFFLFLNYNDAHDPYFPEPPWGERVGADAESDFNGDLWDPRQRDSDFPVPNIRLSQSIEGLSPADIARALALHRAEVSYADNHFGLLLKELGSLGLLENTVIVAVSDHGELFGEHTRMSHSGPRHPELTHVPLLMTFPGGDFEPNQVTQRVDLRDIKPTLLEFLGIADETSEGRSLLPLLREPDAVLPEAAPVSDAKPGQNLLDMGQPEQLDRLRESLKALGYIE